MDEPAMAAHEVLRAGSWTGASDRVLLDHDSRFLRRKRLTTATGREIVAVTVEDGIVRGRPARG